MADVTNPNTETVTNTTQTVVPSEPQTPVTPPAEATEEFDKERAMKTISTLREIEKQAKKDAKELQELRAKEQKRVEAEMTETQRLQKQLADAEAKNAEIAANLLRRDVIAEVNLPSIFADRLHGTTKEELLEDAKKLAELLPKQQPKTAPTLGATNPANGQLNETDAQRRERLFGKQGNPFDLEEIKKRGGGVIFSK